MAPFLPFEILSNIFSRLPVRTLVRFRCVSRQWLAVIDDPDFARSHLTCFNNIAGESWLFIIHQQTRYKSHCVVRTETFDFVDSPTIRRSRGPVRDWEVVGSVDGLFMVRQTAATRRLMLWNPSTRRTLPLPPSPLHPPFLQHRDDLGLPVPRTLWPQYDDLGLGFDPVNRDYKHVRFVLDFKHLAIYSLATDSWRTIGFDQWTVRWDWIPDRQQSLCFKGVLYVLALIDSERPLRLASFNLATDDECLFSELPVDAHLIGEITDHVLTTADAGSSLAIFHFSAAEGTMWVLQAEGWARRYAFPTGFVYGVDDMDFLYLTRNDEIVLGTSDGFTSYNLATGQGRILLTGDFARCKAWLYKENLIRF